MAEVNTKPFICLVEGCDMTFTNQDHLDWHKKKHDMMLNLGLANCKNGEIADQTPTPTRFIRNCEEVGLFQDLQNNPFDEIFKKATEDVKAGHTLEIPQTSTDDTLHTPQIYPQVDHGRPVEFESKPNCGELRLVINEVPQENSNQNESITEELMIDDSDDEERMAKTKLKPVISAMKKKIKEAINKKDGASGTIAPMSANDPYHQEQRKLFKLYSELSSDDEEVDPYHYSDAGSDPGYKTSESSDTDVEEAGPNKYQREELLFDYSSSEQDNDDQSTHSSDAEKHNTDGDRSILLEELESPWETTPAPIPVFDFDEGSVGVKINIDENSTPLNVFEYLFTPQILEYIVQCSNDYGESLANTNRTKQNRSASYRPITVDEMKAFFGLCLLHGQVSTTNVRRFFSYKDLLYYHPIFPCVMSARRYEQILKVLCCSAAKSKGKEKIQILLDVIISQYQNAYRPTKELSLDESPLHFRGRLGFRVNFKNKKDGYGIKFYELRTSDGYVLNMEMYSGHSNDSEGNDSDNTTTEKLVLRLMKPYLLKGHDLFMDDCYNSISLSEKLLKLKTHTNGTLRPNRRGNPMDLVRKKLKRGEHFWVRKKHVYVTKWKDKRDVLVITTRNHPRMITVRDRYEKEQNTPEEVATYNYYISGTDRCDKMTAPYATTRKTIRWYKQIILYLLDLTTWNSFFLYRKYCKGDSREYGFLQFRDDLIKSLIKLPPNVEGSDIVRHQKHDSRRFEQRNQVQNSAQELKGHWPEKNPGTPGGKSQKKSVFLKCRMCTKKYIRRETSYRCKGCKEKPPLCLVCFEEWHD